MTLFGRRALFQVLSASALLGLGVSPRRAHASLVRGLTLSELVRQSHAVSVLRPLDASSHWEVIEGRKLIVTDCAVEVLDHVAKEAPRARRILVRTLGGRVGRVGQLVPGQARFDWGVPSVAFLTHRADVHYVVGTAQGHYPLEGAARPRLLASPDLPEILNVRGSAVEGLVGQSLADARELITRAVSQ